MPVTTHQCDICGESGEHEQIVDHVTSEHDVTQGNAEEYVEPIEDEGL